MFQCSSGHVPQCSRGPAPLPSRPLGAPLRQSKAQAPTMPTVSVSRRISSQRSTGSGARTSRTTSTRARYCQRWRRTCAARTAAVRRRREDRSYSCVFAVRRRTVTKTARGNSGSRTSRRAAVSSRQTPRRRSRRRARRRHPKWRPALTIAQTAMVAVEVAAVARCPTRQRRPTWHLHRRRSPPRALLARASSCMAFRRHRS